jgi:hypothetical protein
MKAFIKNKSDWIEAQSASIDEHSERVPDYSSDVENYNIIRGN